MKGFQMKINRGTGNEKKKKKDLESNIRKTKDNTYYHEQYHREYIVWGGG